MTSALGGEEGFLKADGCAESLCECDGDEGVDITKLYTSADIIYA